MSSIAPRRPAFGPHWRGSFSSERPRVAVFFDWQNAYRTAREAFGMTTMPSAYGNFSPSALARILAAGNDRGASVELVSVEIHRGLPSQKLDRTGYAANRRQTAAWIKEGPELVRPRLRPLRYPSGYPRQPAVEKGVDVSLALGVVEAVLTGECDIAIMFSHDTDLLRCLRPLRASPVLVALRPPPGRALPSGNDCGRRHRPTITTSPNGSSDSSRST